MRYILIMLLAVICKSAVAQVSSGTAFAVAPELLVTNQHVIDGCSSVEIVASDGRRVGSVVAADSYVDLALLRVSGIRGATARLRNPRTIRLGESILVFGFPLAGSLTSGGNFTSGLVSGLRGLRDAAGEIQITAPVQSGNSGGPLMDASGLVIGVVQSKLDALRAARTTGDIPQNVNFAISLDVLADFLAKNKVSFRDGAPAAPVDTARVADLAQSFTYRVECRVKTQQTRAPPNATVPRQGSLSPLVELRTSMGVILLELQPEKAPETVKNFLQYVSDEFYNGTIFHRVIADFMIQGGGFNADMQQKPTREPIRHEGGNSLRNQVATIAMARTSDPNSATAQFFINVVDNQMLDHRGPSPQEIGYVVFGRVIKGFDVVNNIRNVQTTSRSGHRNVPVQAVVIERATVIER
jgi:peptidyl-prolyl cis-trans isomerase B (cyclophilin B)